MSIYSYRVDIFLDVDGAYKLLAHEEVVGNTKEADEGWVTHTSEWTPNTYYKEPKYFTGPNPRMEWATETQEPNYVEILKKLLYGNIVRDWGQLSDTYRKMLSLLL